ncbi:hypothetical protein FB45DRAFT_111831 [Roridomyces roridus]|uniref:DUF6533 domain-containing protein n=1 Tax=Roridomyces roridus TaxID=1738132 RepID=A0AAD7BKP6_9AGAR|nr:hypothetical protein FB45DRAFT_111831 [Roridomyces roridus]
MSNFVAADVIPSLETIHITRSTVFAMYAVAVSEWLETLPTEIELIHAGSRWTSVKMAYLLCRYYPLILWPFIIYAYGGDHSGQVCSTWTQAASICLFPMQLFPPGVMLIRSYAFTGRNPKVLAFLLLCYAGLVSVDIWFFCTNVPRLPDVVYEFLPGGTGCFPDYAVDGGNRLIASIVRPFLVLLCMNFILYKAASSGMDLISLLFIAIYCLRAHSIRGSLGRIFITQGLAAWLAVLTVHAVALGIFFSPELFHNGVGLPCVLILSNLIACRLILDLRRRALPTETQILRRHSHIVDKALADRDVWVIDEEAGEDSQGTELHHMSP